MPKLKWQSSIDAKPIFYGMALRGGVWFSWYNEICSWYCSLRGQINSTLKPVICTLLYELKKIATILFNLALQVHEARMAAEKDVNMAMVAMEVSERNVLMMSTSYELLSTYDRPANLQWNVPRTFFSFFLDNVLNCSTYLRKPQPVGKDCSMVLH